MTCYRVKKTHKNQPAYDQLEDQRPTEENNSKKLEFTHSETETRERVCYHCSIINTWVSEKVELYIYEF
jgi:hypothetical protein